MTRPGAGGIAINGESVDSVEGLEVVEMVFEALGGEYVTGIDDVHPPNVLEEPLFAHVRQEAKIIIGLFPSVMRFLFLSGCSRGVLQG